MTVKELKERLSEFPEEWDDREVIIYPFDWREEYIPPGHTVVTWPDSQVLLDQEWLEEEGSLVDDEMGLILFGGSAYIVPLYRLEELD